MALYSGGVIVASTSQACTSCSMIFDTRASILKAAGSSVGGHVADGGGSSCSISFIHSSLVWCCTMKSISLWSGDSGCCAPSTASRCR
jgi:hypothetical protein